MSERLEEIEVLFDTTASLSLEELQALSEKLYEEIFGVDN
jgi:hypothetical protein